MALRESFLAFMFARNRHRRLSISISSACGPCLRCSGSRQKSELECMRRHSLNLSQISVKGWCFRKGQSPVVLYECLLVCMAVMAEMVLPGCGVFSFIKPCRLCVTKYKFHPALQLLCSFSCFAISGSEPR